MKNLIARLLLFAFGVPCIVLAALFIPHLHYLPISMLILVFAAGSSLELSSLLPVGEKRLPALQSVLAGTVPPLAAYLARVLFKLPVSGMIVAAILSAVFVFIKISAIFVFARSSDNVGDSVSRTIKLLFITMYPGFLSALLITLLAFDDAVYFLLWFAAIVFSNDSLAWLFGITLGRHRGIFALSPKKSLEGLIAGLSGSIAAAVLLPMLVTALSQYAFPVWFLILLGLLCGMAAVIGDLFESAIKRSSNIKDSGTIIPGRGGFLDSFDSILSTIPVFYVMIILFQSFSR